MHAAILRCHLPMCLGCEIEKIDASFFPFFLRYYKRNAYFFSALSRNFKSSLFIQFHVSGTTSSFSNYILNFLSRILHIIADKRRIITITEIIFLKKYIKIQIIIITSELVSCRSENLMIQLISETLITSQ